MTTATTAITEDSIIVGKTDEFVCRHIRNILLLLRGGVVYMIIAILVVAITTGIWLQHQVEELERTLDRITNYISDNSEDNGTLDLFRVGIKQAMLREKMVEDVEKSFERITNYTSDNSEDNRTLDLIRVGVKQAVVREKMSDGEADFAFQRFLMYRHYVCTDYQRLGNDGDGGWNVCMHGRFALTKPCLVYSFGIGYDFSFDDAVSIKYGCTVRSFDPSMKVENHRRGPNIHFYRIGIGAYNYLDRTRGWEMRTLTRIIDDLSDTGRVIDYLKMDVEWSEWSVLQAIRSDPGLADIFRNRVKQFGLEVHFGLEKQKASIIYRYWRELFFLEQDLGFRRWSSHLNYYGAYAFTAFTVGSVNRSRTLVRSCCSELVYINKKFIT